MIPENDDFNFIIVIAKSLPEEVLIKLLQEEIDNYKNASSDKNKKEPTEAFKKVAVVSMMLVIKSTEGSMFEIMTEVNKVRKQMDLIDPSSFKKN